MFKLLKLFYLHENTHNFHLPSSIFHLPYLLFQLVVQLDRQRLVWKSHSMEIVQTCTSTWSRCTRVFGARFAVFVRWARVLPCPNFRSWGFTAITCCFNLLFNWTGTGWFEISTGWRPCKRVCLRGNGAFTCLAHALQRLCDGRACCPALANATRNWQLDNR